MVNVPNAFKPPLVFFHLHGGEGKEFPDHPTLDGTLLPTGARLIGGAFLPPGTVVGNAMGQVNRELLVDGTILPSGAKLPDGHRLGEGPWVFPDGTTFPGGVKIDNPTGPDKIILPDRTDDSNADGEKILGPEDNSEVRAKGFEYKGSYKVDGHIFNIFQKDGVGTVITSKTAPEDSPGWPTGYVTPPAAAESTTSIAVPVAVYELSDNSVVHASSASEDVEDIFYKPDGTDPLDGDAGTMFLY